jgi:AraC-like DNA-binding protein
VTASEQPAATSGLVESLHLSGPRAHAWLRSVGWASEQSAPPLQVAGDVLAIDGFRLSRLWHTPGTLLTDRPARPEDRAAVDLVVPVAGEVRIEGHRAAVRVRPGGFALLRSDDGMRIGADEDSAWLALRTPWQRLGLTGAPAGEEPHEHPAADGYSGAFVSLVNATLNAAFSPEDPGLPELRRALEATAAALVKQSLRTEHPQGGLAALFLRATALIDAEAGDSGFTAVELATRLGVSRATLDRAFRRSGTTVAASLRDRRVFLATSLLAAHPSSSPAARAAVARQAGFPTLRSMDRTLGRARVLPRD